MSASDPDPNATSIQTVARVRALATGRKHVAVCCDSGRSFRRDVDPEYKANRPERDATLYHQISLARETLVADGFPVWAAEGFEADDLIATAATRAVTRGLDVLVVSSDKDLLQLVRAGKEHDPPDTGCTGGCEQCLAVATVQAMSLRDGSVIDAAGVAEKFGVRPEQMCDYLSLVGDSSDNVKGARGIGPKKAVEILKRFGSIEKLYAAAAEHGWPALRLKPSEADSLEEFATRREKVRQLIALRTDVAIPFEEILRDRVPKDVAEFGAPEPSDDPDVIDAEVPPDLQIDTQTADLFVAAAPLATPEARAALDAPPSPEAPKPANGAAPGVQATAPKSTALAVRQPDVLAPAPAEWERQLEPRSVVEARELAKDMFASRLFSAYGTAPGVLATVMAGRELGLPAMASLRAFHVIEGKPTLAADLIRALVLRSGLAEFFRPTERTNERATFETKRKDDPTTHSLTYTIEDGKLQISGGAPWTPEMQRKWEKSGWGRSPADMCVARAGSKLARLIYPEVIFSLYAREEIDA